jgi:arylsulfatase A-like enzyme
MPTILDYLDLDHDENYNKIGGRSLIPLFNGNSMEEEIAFSETGNPLYGKKPPKEPNTRSVRTSKWKYIKNIYDESEELYDIINDPNEEENIIDIDSKVSNELRYKMNEILNS